MDKAVATAQTILKSEWTRVKKGELDMLSAGTREQITWGDGNWLFLDVGSSANKSSSGLLVGDGKACAVQFGEARRRILDHVKHANSPTNLVIEAPLSVCFNQNGNPTGRLIERDSIEGKKLDTGTRGLAAQ